jgi:hypothetical protein
MATTVAQTGLNVTFVRTLAVLLLSMAATNMPEYTAQRDNEFQFLYVYTKLFKPSIAKYNPSMKSAQNIRT